MPIGLKLRLTPCVVCVEKLRRTRSVTVFLATGMRYWDGAHHALGFGGVGNWRTWGRRYALVMAGINRALAVSLKQSVRR